MRPVLNASKLVFVADPFVSDPKDQLRAVLGPYALPRKPEAIDGSRRVTVRCRGRSLSPVLRSG